jgi:hypothetical protein
MAGWYIDRNGYICAFAEVIDKAVGDEYLSESEVESVNAAAALQWNALTHQRVCSS